MQSVGSDGIPVLRFDSAVGLVESSAHVVQVVRGGDPLFVLDDYPELAAMANEVTLLQSRERGADRVWIFVDGGSYLRPGERRPLVCRGT